MDWVPAAHGTGFFKDLSEAGRLAKATRIGLKKLWRIAVLFERQSSFWRDVAIGRKCRERQANRTDPLRRQDQPAVTGSLTNVNLTLGPRSATVGLEILSNSVSFCICTYFIALAAAPPSGAAVSFLGDDVERALSRAV
jgi:hypothetical protein